MKKFALLLCFVLYFHDGFCQDSLRTPLVQPTRALALYPFQKQIGYRSNLTRKWFSDFKGGMTFSALPFFVLEYNRNCRFVNRDKVKVYTGIGITLDSYIPGLQVPFGIEFILLESVQQLSLIAEVKPKISFGPTSLLNISFSPHLGLAYYLRPKHIKK